jgi:hypothetical protein
MLLSIAASEREKKLVPKIRFARFCEPFRRAEISLIHTLAIGFRRAIIALLINTNTTQKMVSFILGTTSRHGDPIPESALTMAD